MSEWGIEGFADAAVISEAQVAHGQLSSFWRFCGHQLSHHLLPQDVLSVLVESLVHLLAKSVIMIRAGNTGRVNRWSLLNEMKLQWSILFVTHPQNRNDYGLLATKVMDIECLLTVGLELPLVKLLHGVNWNLYLFELFCIKYGEICWFPRSMSDHATICLFRPQVKSDSNYYVDFDSASLKHTQ